MSLVAVPRRLLYTAYAERFCYTHPVGIPSSPNFFSVLLSSECCALRTVGLYVTGLRTEENAAVARGFAMALGVLPRKLAGGW